MRTHSVILTPLSLLDLKVVEVPCVILMNKNHTDTLLVKMREEKYILLLFTFHETVCRKQTAAAAASDQGVSSTCFQLSQTRKRASFLQTSKFKRRFLCLTWDELM